MWTVGSALKRVFFWVWGCMGVEGVGLCRVCTVWDRTGQMWCGSHWWLHQNCPGLRLHHRVLRPGPPLSQHSRSCPSLPSHSHTCHCAHSNSGVGGPGGLVQSRSVWCGPVLRTAHPAGPAGGVGRLDCTPQPGLLSNSSVVEWEPGPRPCAGMRSTGDS